MKNNDDPVKGSAQISNQASRSEDKQEKASYDFLSIEEKWQKIWNENKYSEAKDFDSKPKHYQLVEFPYPSGAGLHVGHCMGYGASDAYSRMKRMQGYNVLFPIGWDAFGLPTENYAIKTGRKPQDVTKENTDNFRKQMKSLGYSFDWSREINTSDPDYYRWTQWIFLQFYKHGIDSKGNLIKISDDDVTSPRLAYQAEIAINWCPSCKIGLANEEVIAGKCERCGSEVEKRMQKQWMLRITAYADRLISDLNKVDYENRIKTQQINWIGRSEGTNVRFKVKNQNLKLKTKGASLKPDFIEVFTTRADTLFGCTYVVIAPESDYMSKLKSQILNLKEVEDYIKHAQKKSDMERTELIKEKSGVKLEGIKAINPINNEEVEVWVADYVLASYGTGAVMAVPAHDERDWEFARKYNIPIKDVVIPCQGKPRADEEERHTVTGIVLDKEIKKILMLYWDEFGWYSLPAGGIDKNEKVEEAVAREVFEETGYKVKPIERLGGIIEEHFYADNKKVWRKRFDQPMLCQLLDDKQSKVSNEEFSRHKAIWLPIDEALQKITHPFNKIGIDRYLKKNYAFTDYGYLINSDEFNGLSSEEAKKQITEKLKKMGSGDFAVNYKLRDWVFSRQHYWGEPIPIIYCRKCLENLKLKNQNLKLSNISIIDGQEYLMVPVPEDELPVTLPDVENYQPTDTGESPLAKISDWVNVKCPRCGQTAKRETDTMPNWAGSSWYFLAYAMQKNTSCKLQVTNNKNIFSERKNELKYWMPVDLYNGGMEHTTLHLLYSRFWNKFLFDIGCAPTTEPYQKRIAHGIILGPDGRKMSKSFGNVINPDDMVKKYGADTTRVYIMFIGPYDQESAWSTAGIQGVFRFLNRVYKNFEKVSENVRDDKKLIVKLNQTIKGVTEDIESFNFNTVVSKLMELNNEIEKSQAVTKELFEIFIQLLFPVAPHLAEELWYKLGNKNLVEESGWPIADPKYLTSSEIEIAIQVNGKVRDRIIVKNDASDKELEALALKAPRIIEYTTGKTIIKTIVVPKKLVSIVVK